MDAIEPHSEQSKPTIPPVPWSSWGGALYIITVFIFSQLVGGVLALLATQAYISATHQTTAKAADLLTNSVTGQFLFILVVETLAVAATLAFVRGYKASFATIGLRRPRWSDLLLGLTFAPVYFLLYFLVVGVASQLIPGLNIEQTQEIGFENVHGQTALLLTFISLVVLPPLAEEIMVRGFLYSSLRKGLRLWPAVILTSGIFAVAHLPEGGAAGPLYIAALDTFVLSLVLIYLREKTGGLWASIVLHALKNGVAFIALFVLHVR